MMLCVYNRNNKCYGTAKLQKEMTNNTPKHTCCGMSDDREESVHENKVNTSMNNSAQHTNALNEVAERKTMKC